MARGQNESSRWKDFSSLHHPRAAQRSKLAKILFRYSNSLVRPVSDFVVPPNSLAAATERRGEREASQSQDAGHWLDSAIGGTVCGESLPYRQERVKDDETAGGLI